MNAPPPLPDAATADRRHREGLVLGLAAYTAWGILPIYFKLLADVGPVDIVANRVAWSMVVLVLMVLAARQAGPVRAALANPQLRLALAASAVLIAVNWLIYVYAVNSGRMLAGSLGYYLNPLANILMGRFLLGERLTRLQWGAVALAAAGVAVLAVGALDSLWISLVLCFSFASYGLVRKVIAVDALAGLTVETMMLVPVALGWLVWHRAAGAAVLGHGWSETWLLMAAGVISTGPLLLFTAAARRLPYSTVGMLQFIAPTTQFLIAVLVYHEPLGRPQLIAFAAIWSALGLYVAALVYARRTTSA